jgi:hypothetical protein
LRNRHSRAVCEAWSRSARYHQSHHLALARCERRIAVPQWPHGGIAAHCRPAQLDRHLDGTQHLFRIHGFGEHINRASFHRLDGHTHIRAAGDEHDRDVHRRPNLPLQLETVRAGRDVQQEQATSNRGTGQGQKLLSRDATLDIESGRRH